MKKVTRYVTFDDEEFDTEQEALDHEGFLHCDNHVKFWDYRYNEIPVTEDTLDDFAADYVKINDEKGIDLVDRLFTYIGYDRYPTEIGMFFYDENYNKWVSAEDWWKEVSKKHDAIKQMEA